MNDSIQQNYVKPEPFERDLPVPSKILAPTAPVTPETVANWEKQCW